MKAHSELELIARRYRKYGVTLDKLLDLLASAEARGLPIHIGMLAGAGGSIECLGIYQQLNWEIQLGYGFDGMLIAIIAKNNPLLVPLVGFILSYLRAGGDLVNRMTDVPTEFVSVIQSLVVIFIAAKSLLATVRHRMLIKDSISVKGAD